MALNISGYVDPGVYVGEVVVPGSVSVSTVPLTVCLIGIANRNKRVSNEAVTRGLVSNETLTVGSTPGAHDATLINISNRKSAQMTITKDGVALDSADVSFLAPSVTGSTLTTLDFTTNNKISLAMDGKNAVTIAITSGAGATVIAGSLITVQVTISNIAAVTAAEIASGINKALNDATSLGYGPTYGAVASEASNQVTLTSPTNTSSSDLRLYAAFPAAHSQTVAVFGGSVPFQAQTKIRITDSAWSSTAVFKASYVSTNTDQDALLESNVQTIVRVGNYAGVTSYKENTDFTKSGSNLDWSADAAAAFTSSVASATFDINPDDKIILGFDGKAAVTIDLNAMASPPPGYVNPVDANAATGAEIVNNINAVLANTTQYGPKYAGVATFASNKITLTSPTQGTGSIIEIGAPSLNSAVTTLFGLTSSQLPYSKYGTGARPTPGAIFFATYEYTRPSGDYNTPKRFFTPDSLYADIGMPTATNQLAIAGGLCFDNGAPSVIVVQVNDSNFSGSPTQSEIKTAMDAAGTTASATDVVVLDTRLGVQADLVDHLANQNAPTEKNYRRGWFGMAANTQIGDKDTPETFIYRAVRTLQVASDSPARGRMVLVAPHSATRTITLETGAELDVTVNGAYIAAAVAARMTSFTSPAETLLRKTIIGLAIDDFPTYLRSERGLLAQNGVCVVTLEAGRLVLTDPITTEAGGGKLVTFSEISASPQKDAVTNAMTEAIDANLVGVVPSDLSSFILTIKGFIAGVLNSLIATGAIGPFKNDDGVTRDIDFTKDIQVFQDKTDPTRYFFRYYFNLRLPAKRFFGEYSVNNPFFGG